MKTKILLALTIAALGYSASAHFQCLIPSDDTIEDASKPVKFEIIFTHPMERGPVMEMGKPKAFGALCNGERKDLRSSLKEVKRDGKSAYTADYKAAEPGDCVFYFEPSPYWEPAERKYIIHYTKVVVDALGGGEGWDASAGLPVEIEPLCRPYGLYAGNVFQGIVKKDGKPVPYATIEVEYYNEKGDAKAPTEAHITQVIRSDANGVFTYAMPLAGWWGFAALIDGEPVKGPDGEDAGTELGALIWVKAHPLK